jgi:ribosomal protein L32
MSGLPKKRRSKARQRTSRFTHDKQKANAVNLVELPSGKRVPRHMVTKDNPTHKGVKFIRSKKK